MWSGSPPSRPPPTPTPTPSRTPSSSPSGCCPTACGRATGRGWSTPPSTTSAGTASSGARVWVTGSDPLRPFLEGAGWAADGAHRTLDLRDDGDGRGRPGAPARVDRSTTRDASQSWAAAIAPRSCARRWGGRGDGCLRVVVRGSGHRGRAVGRADLRAVGADVQRRVAVRADRRARRRRVSGCRAGVRDAARRPQRAVRRAARPCLGLHGVRRGPRRPARHRRVDRRRAGL